MVIEIRIMVIFKWEIDWNRMREFSGVIEIVYIFIEVVVTYDVLVNYHNIIT